MDNFNWIEVSINEVTSMPTISGVYKFTISGEVETVVYVGKSINLRQRAITHSRFLKSIEKDLRNQEQLVISYCITDYYLCLETMLIKLYTPKYNRHHNKNRPSLRYHPPYIPKL